jgi:hypothetical protein
MKILLKMAHKTAQKMDHMWAVLREHGKVDKLAVTMERILDGSKELNLACMMEKMMVVLRVANLIGLKEN